MATETSSISSRAVGAGAWTVGTRLATKLIDLVMLLCLARFLGPAEFGLVAIAMAAVFVVEAVCELPLTTALIRTSSLTTAMLDTAFTLSVLRGSVIALLLLAVSWPLALLNNEPRLIGLLAVLALAPALRGLVSPRMVEYARAFNFRPDSAMELSGKAAAFVVAIVIAVTTRSYWAVAAATVCGPLVATLLSYYIAPLRPRLTLTRWADFSNLIGWNFLVQLAAALNWQIDRMLLPRFTSVSVFGQYAMSKQIAEIPTQALLQPLVRPAMAALALTSEGRGFRYLQITRAVCTAMVPFMGVLLLWPEVLVRVALGPAWLEAAEWLKWISAGAMLALPAMMMGPLVMTMDRTHWLAIRTFSELLVRLPLVWIGALQFGVLGAIAGSALATLFGTLVAFGVVRHLVGAGLRAQVTTLLQPLAALLPAAGVLWSTKPVVLGASSTGELLLRAVGFGGLYAITYMCSVMLLWRLAGRPAGLEQQLLNGVQSLMKRVQTESAHGATSPKTNSSNAMEAHAKQPH